jgi:predicted nuclease of predicted toxin-antitoxin system
MNNVKFKVDENLPLKVVEELRLCGYEVASVFDENLQGCDDGEIMGRCKVEARILITLDLDFSNVLLYPPKELPGLIVLRPLSQSVDCIIDLVRKLQKKLKSQKPVEKLWIVEENRIRIRE